MTTVSGKRQCERVSPDRYRLRCQNSALPGGVFCHVHDPERRRQREARRKGYERQWDNWCDRKALGPDREYRVDEGHTITLALTVDAPTGVTPDELRLTLKDAFGDFVFARRPSPEEYVARRYPGEGVYRGQARLDKIEQVRRRCALAEALHRAVSSAVIR